MASRGPPPAPWRGEETQHGVILAHLRAVSSCFHACIELEPRGQGRDGSAHGGPLARRLSRV